MYYLSLNDGLNHRSGSAKYAALNNISIVYHIVSFAIVQQLIETTGKYTASGDIYRVKFPVLSCKRRVAIEIDKLAAAISASAGNLSATIISLLGSPIDLLRIRCFAYSMDSSGMNISSKMDNSSILLF